VPERAEARWLVLIHQIPPHPNYLRVKVWRRLQRLGAVAIKNSVYVLPRTESAREDFEWIRREIAACGGDGAVCEARFVDGLEDEQIVGLFHAARNTDYGQISDEARALLGDLPARVRDEQRGFADNALGRLRRRFAEVTAIDFFAATGQQVAAGLLAKVEARLQGAPAERERASKKARAVAARGRVWVTRAGIHVDRMASAWLIRRSIDPDAKFKFVTDKGYRPRPGELRFDMFEAEFTHEGDLCTFEVLLERFGLDDPALAAIAAIVHDIDVKDAKHGRPETAGVDHMVAGIAMAHDDDAVRLERGSALFDDLYAYFKKKKATPASTMPATAATKPTRRKRK
jgi:hypothetical protein